MADENEKFLKEIEWYRQTFQKIDEQVQEEKVKFRAQA